MKRKILNNIAIDKESITPKYRQLMDGIMGSVEKGEIGKDEGLPSLHEICTELNVSKSTAEKAYNKLKSKGVVRSVRGKGYFIAMISKNYNVH